MIKSILLAIFLLVGVVFSADSCGPPQCYHPCTNAKPVVDFVFMIDVSGSMAPPIEGVKNGLASFVNNLGNNITPRFTLVIFGRNSGDGAAFVYRDATTSASTFISDMTYWVTRTEGGIEPGLETILRALNKSNRNHLNINYNVGQNNKKVFIVVTNEDSDPASSSNANLFSSNGQSQDSSWRDNRCRVATTNYCPFPRSSSTISLIPEVNWSNAWQLEINAAANALIEADVNVYMFVAGSKSIENSNTCDKDVSPSQTCLTKYQYCNPDRQSQNSTFGNFNAATTLSNMNADGTKGSLQDKLLSAGKIMRCFDVYDTSNSALVQNFFSEIVSDVSKCYTTCLDYICTSPTTCAPPVNRCGCDGVKYSNATYDPDGACCVEKDCNGYCNNKYSYDTCGICTLGGATHPQCKTDCNGNKYLGFTSAPTGIKYQVQTINAAGYLLMNNDIKNAYVSTWRNVAAIQTHFHDYGVFESRSYCTFDLAKYNQDYSTSFNQASAEADWLAKLLTTGPRNAQCAAGSRRRFPPLPTDQCGQCIVNADAPPTCIKDCTGAWRGASEQHLVHVTDNCGVCVAPGTDADANKDDCGVCFGNNASKNECDVCGGVKGNDLCDQPLCEGLPCGTDCDGENRNPSEKNLDECGLCVNRVTPGGAPGRHPDCIQDCAGNWYQNGVNQSIYIIDECGNCVKRTDIRAPGCVKDCAGVWNGTAVYDACGQCVINGVTPHQCLVDCAGTPYTSNNPPPKSVDDCGICNAPEDANELKDQCGICTNLPGYNSAAQCTPDCKGTYRLITDPNRAFTDACGECWFANQTDQTNSKMDSCGVCHVPLGPADPDWNQGSGVVDSRGFPCACGQTPADCSDGTNTCTDSCPVYCPNTANVVQDGCGFCPGHPYYNKTDSCGLCCDGTEASPCDTALDSCGVCFGFDQDKQNPCGICDPHGTKCVQDCKGVWGGNAVVGCDGVCDSNAVCAECGDGEIQDGETCDLGSTNGQNNNVAGSGCSPECQTESGGNVGAAIGGAIGGIAAIAALALAAFFAVRYAKKAGLIGNANKQVDFGASNTNPLYKSEVSVHQNPLYAN